MEPFETRSKTMTTTAVTAETITVVSRKGWAVRTADGLPTVGDHVADVKENQLYLVVEAYRPELGRTCSGDSVYRRRVQLVPASWDDVSDAQIHTARLVWDDPIYRA